MSETPTPQPINVKTYTLATQSDVEALAPLWKTTFSQSNTSFFLSWRWIKPFALQALEKGYRVHAIQASSKDSTPLGLAIFCERSQTRHKVFRYNQLFLHKTGDDVLDKTWIEYNDFLLNAEHEQTTRVAMWQFINSHFNHIDEFVVGLSTRDTISNTKRILPKYFSWDYIVDTGLVLTTPKNELPKYKSKQLTSNIKRSNKLLAASSTSVVISDDNNDFLQALESISPMHKATWKQESGFYLEEFKQYLAMLTEVQDETRLVSALLKTQERVVAALIGFVHNETFYYYLSVNETSENNKVKHGLSLHHYVIEWCAKQGINRYDFLAGDYRYKRSFTNESIEFSYTHFQRPTMKAKLETKLRLIKKKLFSKE